jgi:hypothetical protein
MATGAKYLLTHDYLKMARTGDVPHSADRRMLKVKKC